MNNQFSQDKIIAQRANTGATTISSFENMKTKNLEPIPPMKAGQWNSYRPEDVKRWGIERFLDEVAPKEPLEIPDLGFTEEENRRMDEILREEREAANNDI